MCLIDGDQTEFSIYERAWLNALLEYDFPEKQLVAYQLNSAAIEREYTAYHLFLKFSVDKAVPPILTSSRTDIEMCAYKEGEVPTAFVLHIIDGYVAYLEVFHGDSSKISCDFDIGGAKLEYFTP